MQAVILAGGKGTRLASIHAQIPKPMVRVGALPVLEYQVNLLKAAGITDIIILVNHLKESIQSYFQQGEKWGVKISYYEETEPLGTVGGIKAVEEQLHNDFLVLYGDVMMDIDIKRLIDFHISKKSDCTLVVHPNDHPYDSDLVDIDIDGRIVGFHSKPHDPQQYYRNLVNAGCYLFTQKILQYLKQGVKADFGKDIFPNLVNEVRMFGYNTSEYLKDMGTPDRLEKVTKDFLSGKIAARNLRHQQKAIFLDRDGVLNVDREYIAAPADLVLYPFAAEAVTKINGTSYLAIVITNQPVVARNLCSEAELQIIHNKLETELGAHHAMLDAIYYCPHHPDKGYPDENPAYKIDCHCRKPKPGMLLDAARDFNIDLSASYFIGDHERDIEAGQQAGVKTIGVKTGHGLKGSNRTPDQTFENLLDAIDFIIRDSNE
ncbi:MAG TPA: HAD-IIIA family hydrolase [Cyclobacteriaceae bacterium]|nr:HAD-IIIA family hydrolase [Cyclobacteriaceae bacterium]